MVRYLISIRGADCRIRTRFEYFPLYWAAACGHLEIVRFLSQVGGAHEDIRKVTMYGECPLRVALENGHFEVVQWLILNGALALRDDMDGGGIDDAIMRSDLRQGRIWREDRRRTVVSWARGAVTTHDNVTVLLTGMNLFPDEEVPEVLELIAHYVVGTQQQLRTLRQLIDRLPAFIDDVPFVEYVPFVEEEDSYDGEDEDDY